MVRGVMVLAVFGLATAACRGDRVPAARGAPGAPGHQAPDASPLPWTLDHTPIAVRDLAAAQSDFERLGFVLKPGRPHANSIRNAHMKFPGGDELELITATEPRDGLARHYLALLRRGEGAAFIALRTDSVTALVTALRRSDSTLRADTAATFLFINPPAAWRLPELFAMYLRSPPVDSARFLAHPNGAWRLLAAWIALDSAAESDFGAFHPEPVPADSAPLGRAGSRVARFSDGRAIYILPRAAGDTPVTRILGVTVAVRDIERAAALLGAAFPDAPRMERTTRGRRLLIPPGRAHGVWVELLERRPA